MAIEAEIKRTAPDGVTLVAHELAADVDSPTGFVEPTADHVARADLEAIRALLGGTLKVDHPETYRLPVDQEEALTPAPGLAKDATLDAINANLAAIRDRDGFPLPADQVTTLTPRSSVEVSNHPAEFPLPAGQVSTLTPPSSVGVTNFPDVQQVAGTADVTGSTVAVANPTADPETGLAKDATLELVRVLAAEVRDLVTTIRDEQHRRTDKITLVDGTTVRMTNDLLAAHAIGRNYVGGKRLNIGGALSSARYVAALRNPADSGRVAFIYAVVLYTNSTQWFRWAQNPVLSTPTVEDPARSLNLANPDLSAVEMISAVTAPTDAEYWDPETRVTTNAPVPLQFPTPVPIPPGMTFAVVGDSSSGQETSANVYFYEQALA